MKRQADKSGMRSSKRSKVPASSRRNYRNHESSRENAKEPRDERYSSSSRNYRQRSPAPKSRERDIPASPPHNGDRIRESKREMREKRPERPYKVLAVQNFSSQVSNEDIEESLYFEYRKFGEVSVRVVESHGKRVAYCTFKYSECAADAKNAKGTLLMYDRRLDVEAVMDKKSGTDRRTETDYFDRDRKSKSDRYERRARSRSYTPPPARSSTRYDNSDKIMSKRSPVRYEEPISSSQNSRRLSYDYDDHDESRHSYRSPDHERGVDSDDILPEDDPYATRTLFVGNLEGSITNNNIRRAFETYGRIDDIDIKRQPHGTAYAFVRFLSLDDAYQAKVSLNGRAVLDNIIKVGYGKPIISSKLWVGGLGNWISLGTLEREFDRFGAIRKIDYERGTDHAYILYESLDAAREACAKMKGTSLPGSDVRLRIDFADPVAGLPGWDEWENRKIERERELERRQSERYDNRRQRGRGRAYDNRRYNDSNRKYRDRSPNNEREQDGRFNDRYGRGNRGGYNRRRSTSPYNKNDREKFNPPQIDRQLLFKQVQAKGVVDLHQLCNVFNPPLWDGCVVVKKTAFAIRLFALDGDVNIFYKLLEHNIPEGNVDLGTFVSMNQKISLEDEKMEVILKRSKEFNHKWCLLLGVPGMPTIVNIAAGKNTTMFSQQRPLRGLVRYFKDKSIAGVASITIPNKNAEVENAKEKLTTEMFYAFPPGKIAKEKLYELAPNLNEEVIIDEYLVILAFQGSL